MILSGKDKKEILEKLEPLDGIKTALVALNKTLADMNCTMKAMNAKLDKPDAIDAKLDRLLPGKMNQQLHPEPFSSAATHGCA